MCLKFNVLVPIEILTPKIILLWNIKLKIFIYCIIVIQKVKILKNYKNTFFFFKNVDLQRHENNIFKTVKSQHFSK